MTSQEEQTFILSDSDNVARVRQGYPGKVRAICACCVLVTIALTSRLAAHQGVRQPARASTVSVSNSLAKKAEEDKKDDDPAMGPIYELKLKSEHDMDDAKKDKKAAEADKKAAEDVIGAAVEKITQAEDDSEKAHKMESHAKDVINESNKKKAEAALVTKNAKNTIAIAKDEANDAKVAMSEAKKLQASAKKEQDKVAGLEKEAMTATAKLRACVDLPGVQLVEPGGEDGFAPVEIEKVTDTPEACALWCKGHDGCSQTIYEMWGKSCKLYKKATTDIVSFRDGFNSSYCGNKDSQASDLKGMLKKVFDRKPYVPDVVECAMGTSDDNDCTTSKCCAHEECTWDFKECKPHSCFSSGDSASCMAACYGNFCDNQGTGREQRETPPAKDGVLTQGTSLYCFVVVAWEKPGRDQWSASEVELFNNMKEKKASIYECDDHDVFDGGLTAVTDWSTYLNVDLFLDSWTKVQESGKYAGNDWTVKVDVDAVFFPSVLKQHLEGLRTPQGSRVYLRNIEHKFMFLGALEVMTREAVQLYFEKGWKCKAWDHGKWSEDYYMKHCLDAIGSDHQVDTDLLTDRVKNPSSTKLDCTNGWTVAWHWQRSVDDWNKCHDQGVDAQAEARKLWLAEHGQ